MIYVFVNQKGGVGKTTTTGNMASALSEHGTVLIVDFDPQGNLSSWFRQADQEIKWELADVLWGDKDLKQVIHESVWNGIDVLPTFKETDRLSEWSDLRLLLKNDPAIGHLFADLAGEYDYILCDTNPDFGALEREVYAAANKIIPVLEAEEFSIDGLEKMNRNINDLEKTIRRPLNYPFMVVNKFNASATTVHGEFLKELNRREINHYVIHKRTDISKTQKFHVMLDELNPKSDVLPVYKEMAEVLRVR